MIDFNVRDRVRLDSGLVLTVTDRVDKSAPEVQENPDDLCIGIDNHGRWHVFPEWEVIAVEH